MGGLNEHTNKQTNLLLNHQYSGRLLPFENRAFSFVKLLPLACANLSPHLKPRLYSRHRLPPTEVSAASMTFWRHTAIGLGTTSQQWVDSVVSSIKRDFCKGRAK